MPSTEFTAVRTVRLVRGEPASRSPAYKSAVAEHWQAASERNPRLFNGPVVAPLDVSATDQQCTVSWYHSDFAHYLFSRHDTNHPGVGTVFVSLAVPTTDGRLVAGKMAAHTATPGVIQLPGGGVPADRSRLDLDQSDLAAVAAQEAAEELGLAIDPADLQVCGVIVRRNPIEVGVVFAATPRSWDHIQAMFTARQHADRCAGVPSELDSLLALTSTGLDHLNPEAGRIIDYLPATIRALQR
jgi:8-oxo-dGTP pyrophosphatase MutT (NUDIX family)